ncbi:hypothetical protein TIFTF001_048383 [Ficus carica]|uniref:Uncharacterized protein n=1 Tax=Ficus carica TaxID=3494 RepID=A0AA87ZM72_FICCA|nr:hypothetical protein TIFTF001_048383 [Ficus carica]
MLGEAGHRAGEGGLHRHLGWGGGDCVAGIVGRSAVGGGGASSMSRRGVADVKGDWVAVEGCFSFFEFF